MVISLENIKPVFLEQEKVENSQVWNNNLEIASPKNIMIIAPSGSGKTSFIHFLYGLRKDYIGNIYINQKLLKHFTPEQIAGMRSGECSIIFQDLRLFPDHTAFENINIKRVLNPYHGKERIQEMAARLGIENKLLKKTNTCSYGEQQRIAIIRALQQPFDILLMDEPFSNLDDGNKRKAMELIKEEVSKRNASIVLADLRQHNFFSADHTINL